MKPAMKAKLHLLNSYSSGEFRQSINIGFATVCLGIRRDALFITTIHVHKLDRYKGHGQHALTTVLEVCDRFGAPAALEVRPFDGNRSQNLLRLWYESHGFYPTSGRFMKRQPGASAMGYGRWADNPKGKQKDSKRCIKEVFSATGSYTPHQCHRPRGHGQGGKYCSVHAKSSIDIIPLSKERNK